MSDFETAYSTSFYAAPGAPAQPADAVAADDSAERATLQAAIVGGDPDAISAAATKVIVKDLTQLAAQVAAYRTSVWHLRLMLAAIGALYPVGIAEIDPAIVNALRAEPEQETMTGGHPAAASVLASYLAALESNSAATLT